MNTLPCIILVLLMAVATPAIGQTPAAPPANDPRFEPYMQAVLALYPEMRQASSRLRKAVNAEIEAMQLRGDPELKEPDCPLTIGHRVAKRLGIIPVVIENSAPNPMPVSPASYVPTEGGILYDAYPDSSTENHLTITNGTNNYALVKLIEVKTGRNALTCGVLPHQDAGVDAIPNGTYRLIFALGDQLLAGQIPGKERFASTLSACRFEREIVMRTVNEGGSIHYTAFSATLNKVPDGNAKTITMAASEFDKY